MADNVELADRVLHELYDNYGGPETVGIPYGQAVRAALAAAGLVIESKDAVAAAKRAADRQAREARDLLALSTELCALARSAAKLEGMERAAVIADDWAKGLDPTRGIAATIRAEIAAGGDDG